MGERRIQGKNGSQGGHCHPRPEVSSVHMVWVKSGSLELFLFSRDGPQLKTRLKDAHRQIKLANHPDRGGAPYLASKINEAKDLLERELKGR